MSTNQVFCCFNWERFFKSSTNRTTSPHKLWRISSFLAASTMFPLQILETKGKSSGYLIFSCLISFPDGHNEAQMKHYEMKLNLA